MSGFLMPLNLLTNFEILYYQNKPKFNGVFSRNKLTKIKDAAYAINLEVFKSIGTHWIVLYVNGNNIYYLIALEFDIFQKKLKIYKKNNKYF